MPEKTVLVISTFADSEQARNAIYMLVSEKLAACGTMVKGVESLYAWKGEIETSSETLVFLKAPERCYAAVEARLRQLHTYEVPEIVAVDISHGFPKYLEWVDAACLTPA